MQPTEAWIEEAMRTLRETDRERRPAVYPQAGGKLELAGRTFLNFASNDYLNLARAPEVMATAARYLAAYGAGATASRLVAGTLTCHEELEHRLARFKGYPAALVLGSGYAANVGLIPALAGRGDHVFIDRLAHASLVDGAMLSRASLHRFRHNDAAHLNELIGKAAGKGRRLIVTESVFSMDGDLAPLADLAAVARTHDAMLLVDEAHATGVFGPGGRGLVHQVNVEATVNLCMGTLSKALGGYGGFVACSDEMRQWLVNRVRSFIYSTGLPPVMAGAALGALEVIAQRPDLGAELLSRAAAFRSRLKEAGLNTGDSASQIVPVIIGGNDAVMRLAQRLKERGIIAAAIRPPTVPEGTARLRLSVTLAHEREDLERAAGILIEEAGRETCGRGGVSA